MTSSISPDARRIWRAWRAPSAIVLLIVAAGIVAALLRGGGGAGALDPASATPAGSRALARLLAAQRVAVEPVHTLADARRAAAGATVLVTRPDRLPEADLRELRDVAARLVLIAPAQDALGVLLPGAWVAGEAGLADRAPACAQQDAVVAGTARMGGIRYRAPGATECYPDGAAATMIESTVDDRTVTLLGTGEPLTNEHLDEQGNAALSMRLLGRHDRLVWFVPSPGDPALRSTERPIAELVPDGVRFGLLQLGIAVVLFALWRARRLGPVVTEPLPVVVRAAETVEGRARLYRRAAAADHAAEALREAARDRLARRLGLPRDAGRAEVVTEVARHTGRPETETDTLLYGPPATGEAELVRLAGELDALRTQLDER